MTIDNDNRTETLQQLYEYFNKNERDVTYESASSIIPYDLIKLKIYSQLNGKSIFWPVELSFLPGLEQEIKGAYIMQCFVPVLVQVPVSLNETLAVMINRINTRLPLVGFGLLEPHSILYFKHNLLLPYSSQSIITKIMQETLTMISYLLFNFFEAFLDVVTNKKTVEEAISSMPLSFVYC